MKSEARQRDIDILGVLRQTISKIAKRFQELGHNRDRPGRE